MSQIPKSDILTRKKAPAAAHKTSTKLARVTKYKERHFCHEKKRLRPPGRAHQADTHGSPYPCTYMKIHIYIYIYIWNTGIHIYCTKKKYINYTENRESRLHMKNADLTGKYHEVTFSWKPWNDPTVNTVISPVALRFKHGRKPRFSIQNVSMQILIKVCISG